LYNILLTDPSPGPVRSASSVKAWFIQQLQQRLSSPHLMNVMVPKTWKQWFID
jgi:hypothetical protein